jgi:DNA-binding XRE family transcriptional regulator
MMGRKRTAEELAAREGLAQEFKTFRQDFKFSQKKLVDTIGQGLCRRTLQMIEAGGVNPNPETLKKFRNLVKKHKTNKGR